MSARPYGIGVYGASGFTGQRIVLYLAQLQSTGRITSTILIGGRSESKLLSIVQQARRQAGSRAASVRMDVLDNLSTDNAAGLVKFAEQVQVVINAAGPYRFLGPPVVAACIAARTDYCDVTGEPEFIEKMILQHDTDAQHKQLTIVHACGFDSIPSDVGSLYTMDQVHRIHGEAVVSGIEAIFTLKMGQHGMVGNIGTWSSLVHSLSGRKTLLAVRKQLRSKYAAEGGGSVKRLGSPTKPSPVRYDERLRKWVLLFPGADSAIVRNTQTQMAVRGYTAVLPYFSAFFTMPSIFHVALMFMFGLLLQVLSLSSYTRRLMLDYPRLFSFGMFSHDGPSQQQMEDTSLTFDFFASGYPTATSDPSLPLQPLLHTQVHMPEPGYVATPILAVQAALTILDDRAAATRKLPIGVLTPGAAFRQTDLVSRLTGAGIRFVVAKGGQ